MKRYRLYQDEETGKWTAYRYEEYGWQVAGNGSNAQAAIDAVDECARRWTDEDGYFFATESKAVTAGFVD